MLHRGALSWGRWGRGLLLFCSAVGVAGAAPSGSKQDSLTAGNEKARNCPSSGRSFSICFPNVFDPAPNTGCGDEGGQAAVSSCFDRVCRGVSSEAAPGFFNKCCRQGAAKSYDSSCVQAVERECSGVASYCETRCPPLDLLFATEPPEGRRIEDFAVAAPPPACFDTYPSYVGDLCGLDPYCCDTEWDQICVREVTEARAQAVP